MAHRLRDESVSDGDIGDCIGDFVTVRLLGRGGMGSVYEARHAGSNERVALKVMHATLAGGRVPRERFLREAELTAQVRHPHVVQVLGTGVEQNRPFIVMELLRGETLASRLARGGPFSLGELVELFVPLCSAVHAIHEAGVVHRDLKATNILLARRSSGVEPVILDFGISKLDDASDETSLTQSASVLGTLGYLSPEQILNAKSASALSDQYALGVLLYECAAGKRPFTGQSQYELMRAIIDEPLTPPSVHAPHLPLQFDALVQRAMSRDVSRRFASVRALGSALLACGENRTWTRWAREVSGVDERDTVTEIDFGRLIVAPSTGSSPRKRQGPVAVHLVLAAALASAVTALVMRGAAEGPQATHSPDAAAAQPVSPTPLKSPHRVRSAAHQVGNEADGGARQPPE